MPLTLMYITNNPKVAEIAQDAGVDRIWVDMEYLGKSERQNNIDTVKNHHTVEDVRIIRSVCTSSELMVRVNPIHDSCGDYFSSEEEVNSVIEAGADVVMLPMFKTPEEVRQFIAYVGGRAKVQLLVETVESVERLDEILDIPGIDEIHIGLNDLHLAMKLKFMFELLCDGTVEKICCKIRKKGIKYGFGGIARVGYGLLPAEYIITEHYRLGSSAAILSRSFCNANVVSDPSEIRDLFLDGVRLIRKKENEVLDYSEKEYLDNLDELCKIVRKIVEE